jgi:uncharacterized lipoprotein YmbA
MKVFISLLLALLMTGCGGFLRPSKSELYSLDVVAPAGPGSVTGGTPIGIDGVELPPGIDRREIVVRGANLELEARGREQWAAPLEAMVMHTLAFDLARRLPTGMVVLPGQAKPAGAMRSLFVVFEDLAAGSDNVFVLDAQWTLVTPGAPGRTGRERITVQLSSLDSSQIASGMSQALAALSERILAGL